MKQQDIDLEASFRELSELEQYFNQPDFKLDEAMARHKRALALAKGMLAYLDEAETTIEKLSVDSLDTQSAQEEGYEEINK